MVVRSKFQLTRPRKARPDVTMRIYNELTNFNSRAHARRDSAIRLVVFILLEFQLTRPRKARRFFFFQSVKTFQFQLTRPRKARLPPPALVIISFTFQLTRPRKARRFVSFGILKSLLFQLTRPRKARQELLARLLRRPPISSLAPSQGACGKHM